MIYFIRKEGDLEKFIQSEPLISKDSFSGMRDHGSLDFAYFGVGLCNKHQLSNGLPIDVLSMVLVSEAIVSREKTILIADSHAKGNGFGEKDILKASESAKQTLERAIHNLNFDRWRVFLASDLLDCSFNYQMILREISEQNEYVKREVTDMQWFREWGTKLKVGWSLEGERDSSETSFDSKHTEIFGSGMSFLYTIPGRTFDPKHPRAAPYFCDDEKSRILLSPEEVPAEKIEMARCKVEDLKNRLEKFDSKDFAGLRDDTDHKGTTLVCRPVSNCNSIEQDLCQSVNGEQSRLQRGF